MQKSIIYLPVRTFLFCFFIFFFFVEATAQSSFPAKPHIAVLNLESHDISESEAATLSDQLRGHLVNLNAFIVLDRSTMEELLQEQGLQQTGCTRTECAVQVGRVLNVQKIVAGSIGKIGKTYAINLSMINVESSRIEKSFNRKYEGKVEGLLEILQDIAQEIAGRKLYKLALYSSPKGAEVILNNKYLGKTPLARQVPAGSNLKIWVKAVGYQDWEKALTMTRDETLNIELEQLKRAKVKSSSRKWIWVAGGVGAAAIGATAYLATSLNKRDPKAGSLPPLQWPPVDK